MKKKNAGRPATEWPKEKIALLKKHYPTTGNEEVATMLSTTVSALRNAATYYKVKKANRYWDKPETDFILKNWDALSPDEIADGLEKKFKIKKTKWAVINKYRELMGLR
ncbi:MAG TPA: hypothetical protein VK666_20210 [Chryseolinea sp.]|nr:hypothetical protein [Chryseolinea sp.]